MRNILAIARYEYGRHIRRRGFLFTALGIPLLIAAVVAIIVVVTSRSGAELRLGLVDHTGRFAGVDTAALDVDPPIPVERFGDEASAGRALEAGRIDAYVVIPADCLGSGVVAAFGRRRLSEHAQDEVRALLRLPLADIPAWQIAASLLLLALSTAGAILLAARVLRIGMLRYGKRLSIREMLGEA